MDDVALVAAVQRGNEEALADLFEECHGWTYSTCLNALRDPDAAEEATARVFEVAVRTRLAGAYALRPAMIRLIHDTCHEVEGELGRKKWLRRKGEQPPAAPDPKDLRLVAWRAAGDLTPQDRILFALAAGMALTNESIALAVAPDKPAAIAKRLDRIREHVVADVLAARSLDDCPDLRDTLRYAAKEPDAAARKKVHAHVAGRRGVAPCPKCSTAYQRWPLAALAALLPLTAVPPGLSDRLLDRMELALRAGLAAGTDRVRAVKGVPAVIDGATGEALPPRRPRLSTPAPRHAPSAVRASGLTHEAPAPAPHARPGARPGAGTRPPTAAPSGGAHRSPAAARTGAETRSTAGPRTPGGPQTSEGSWTGEVPRAGAAAGATHSVDIADAPTVVLPTPPRPASEAPGAEASAPPTGTPDATSATGPAPATPAAAPADPAPAAGSGPDAGAGDSTHRRPRPFATTAVLTATLVVLGAAGVATLATHRGPVRTTESLATDPTALAAPQESPVALQPAAPGPSPAAGAPRPTEATEVELPVARTSPSTTARPSIRPVAGSAAPSPTDDPFAALGTLTIVSPAYDTTLSTYDADARLASATLAVDVPDGFDTTLLDSTLTWSGTYVRQQVTQYVDLGSGQGITVDLQAAARCTTAWTITATLTPPNGAPQYASTEVTITC